jgi:hypothetical protein
MDRRPSTRLLCLLWLCVLDNWASSWTLFWTGTFLGEKWLQLHIRIEMCFGLMVTKWRILTMPLCIRLCNVPLLFGAIAILHNFCIDERESLIKLTKVYRVPAQMQQPHEPTISWVCPTFLYVDVTAHSNNSIRDTISQLLVILSSVSVSPR